MQTRAMLVVGFAGLGYVGVRSGAKGRSAIAWTDRLSHFS
jgi:hypothetical protein